MKSRYLRLGLFFFLSVSVFTACVPKRKLVYLQPPEAEGGGEDKVFLYDRKHYRLQVNDIIDVQVRSMNNEANELFNGQSAQGAQQMQVGAQGGGDIYYMTGYSVNDSGYVELPVVGGVLVEGLTIPEAKTAIEEKVEEFYSKYYLKVQLGGIRYAALGEFNSPGKYVVLQNQLTIFEAISNAGDMNMVASRKDITLIRQYPDGTRIHKLNLLDQSIINSPFYFIQPNDVIYAEPLRQKSFGLGVDGAQTIATIVSIVSSSLALVLAIQGLR